MSLIANEIRFGAQNSYTIGVDSYDSTKVGLGPLIRQYTDALPDNKFVGPLPLAIGRPVETGGAVPGTIVNAISWSSNIDWLFICDAATGAATRRIQMYTYNRTTAELLWKGFITVSFPYAGTQGVYVIRGSKVLYDKYTTGTAAVSGTTVTGTSTAWTTANIPAGCRIGFGSTNPSAITTWYEISAVGGNGAITLTTDAGTIGDGAYVIEDLRIAIICTNATTATNGGLFLIKGIKYENFNSGGTPIAASTGTNGDSLARTTYWLKDAATTTNIAGIGIDYTTKTDWTNQMLYQLDTVANPFLFKFNLRAPLTITGTSPERYSTSAFVWKTGAHGALTGAPAQTNNFVVATTSHGTGSGILCGYFVTASRFYRTADLSGNLSGSVSWAGDNCLEVPPGSTNVFAVTGSLNSLTYASLIDKFIITTGGRAYCTGYKSSGTQWDRIFLTDNKQVDQVSMDTVVPVFPTFSIGAPFALDTQNGMLFLVSTGTTALLNFVYAIPYAADWEYVSITNNRVILPAMTTANAALFLRAYFTCANVIGPASGQNLGITPEPIRLSYRLTGISDNSGSFTPLSGSGDLASVPPNTQIQLAGEFRIMGNTCIPGRLFAAGIIYQDLSTDSHYQISVGKSSLLNKQFAWRFATAFGTTVPRLQIRLYDAITNSLLLTDDTTTASGTWEKSTDGGSNWVAWTNDDKGASTTTYLRYTPASLADNIKVRALLTQYV